jgi:hypothetical protein
VAVRDRQPTRVVEATQHLQKADRNLKVSLAAAYDRNRDVAVLEKGGSSGCGKTFLADSFCLVAKPLTLKFRSKRIGRFFRVYGDPSFDARKAEFLPLFGRRLSVSGLLKLTGQICLNLNFSLSAL